MSLRMSALVYVEGETDVPVVSAVMRAAGWGGDEYMVFAKGGSRNVKKTLREQAVKSLPVPRIFIIDADGHCPVELRRSLLPGGSVESVLLRVCDNEIESWILADDRAFSRFFNMPLAKVESPDGVDAKERMLRSVYRLRTSNAQDFAREPSKHSGKYRFGSRYHTLIRRFIDEEWDAQRAAQRSDSLKRAVQRLGELHDRFIGGELS